MIKIINEDISQKITGEISRKRVVCARCGKTWIELVGFIAIQKEGGEDVYLRIGMESENCQICSSRSLECPRCGSKEVYEIRLTEEEAPLSLKSVRKAC